jgi:hypothetical protein
LPEVCSVERYVMCCPHPDVFVILVQILPPPSSSDFGRSENVIRSVHHIIIMWLSCSSHLPSFFDWWHQICEKWHVAEHVNPFPPLTQIQYEHVDFLHGKDATPAVPFVVVPSWGEPWMLFAFWNHHIVRWHPHRVSQAHVWCDVISGQPANWPYPAEWDHMVWLAEQGEPSLWMIHDLLWYQGTPVYHRIWHYTQRMWAIQRQVMEATLSTTMGWERSSMLLPAEYYQQSFLGLPQGWYSATLACGFVMKPVYTLPTCDISVLDRFHHHIHGMMLYAAHTMQEWGADPSPQQLFWTLCDYGYLTVRSTRAPAHITWYETEQESVLDVSTWKYRALSAEKRDVVLCCFGSDRVWPLHPLEDTDVVTTVNHVVERDVNMAWADIHHL